MNRTENDQWADLAPVVGIDEAPEKSNSSYGRWVVRYYRVMPNRHQIHDYEYFWKKADALKWVETTRSVIENNLGKRAPDCIIHTLFLDDLNPDKARQGYCQKNCSYRCLIGQDYKRRAA